MDLSRIATSTWGSHLIITLARRLPRRAAYAIGDVLLGRLARKPELPFVRTVRSNLAGLHGLPEDHPDLDAAVARLFRNSCRSYVDFLQASGRSREAVAGICRFDAETYALMEQAALGERGFVLVGAHTCSFDFLLIAMGRWCPDLLVLSRADPVGSSTVMNALRARLGLRIAPLCPAALRDAVGRLREGGIVAMAGDIPLPDGEELDFFGRPARLPTGYARLALSTDSELMVGISRRLGPGRYQICGECVPPPAGSGDRRHLAREWAQLLVHRLEGLLRRCPDEWLMPHPVWASPAPASNRL